MTSPLKVNGTTGTVYTYSPYGTATADGDVTQPLPWSSGYADEEPGLTYYNYRYYNPIGDRWSQRDIILEYADYSLSKFWKNIPVAHFGFLGGVWERNNVI